MGFPHGYSHSQTCNDYTHYHNENINRKCSFSGVVLKVSKPVGIREIIGSDVFSKSRFNNTFNDFRYEREIIIHCNNVIIS